MQYRDEGALATISAFAHAVNNVLMHMRRSIDDQDHNMVQSGVALARYWTSFTGMEAVLEALAMLCGRVRTPPVLSLHPDEAFAGHAVNPCRVSAISFH
jgi:hypothetical protein